MNHVTLNHTANNLVADKVFDHHSHFTFQFISTGFLHGSKGEEFTELRASTVKGVMRFWFRAALAGRVSLSKLKELEGEVFGVKGVGRERLRIRVALNGSYRREVRKDRSRVPHKAADLPPVKESSLNPGAKIELSLSSVSSKAHLAAAASLALATTLGGLGARSHRGAGSIVLTSESSLFEPYLGARAEEWESYLQGTVRKALGELWGFAGIVGGEFNSPAAETHLTIPNISEGGSGVYLSTERFSTEEELRRELMLRMRFFKNEIFGLPLRHPGVKTPPGRFPSPLWFRAFPLTETIDGVATPRVGLQVTVVPPFPVHPDAVFARVEELLSALHCERSIAFSEYSA